MDKKDIRTLVLENLSFYDGMRVEDLLLSFPEEDVVGREDLSMDDLNKTLSKLRNQGLIKRFKDNDGDTRYLRILKRTLGQRIMTKIKKGFSFLKPS